MNQKDKRLLQDLAKQVAEVASLPIMAERREMWKRHNHLERPRPMILVFPEGSWRELLPQSELKCEDENARRMEWNLRHRLYYHEHFYDDTVIEKEWVVRELPRPYGRGFLIRRKEQPLSSPSVTFRSPYGSLIDSIC
jgi:hypothetical protein